MITLAQQVDHRSVATLRDLGLPKMQPNLHEQYAAVVSYAANAKTQIM